MYCYILFITYGPFRFAIKQRKYHFKGLSLYGIIELNNIERNLIHDATHIQEDIIRDH